METPKRHNALSMVTQRKKNFHFDGEELEELGFILIFYIFSNFFNFLRSWNLFLFIFLIFYFFKELRLIFNFF